MVRDLFNELGLGNNAPINLSNSAGYNQLLQDIGNRLEQSQALPIQPTNEVIDPSTQQIPTNAIKIGNARGAENRTLNPLSNAIEDFKDIGTGLTYLGTHIPETIGAGLGYFGKTWEDNLLGGKLGKAGVANPVNYLSNVAYDTVNLLISHYGVSLDDAAESLAKIQMGDFKGAADKIGSDAATLLLNAYQHPVMTALDVNAVSSLLGKGGKAGNVVSNISKGAGGKVSVAIDTSSAAVKSKTYKVQDALGKINQEVSKPIGAAYKESDLTNAIKLLETGTEATTESEKAAAKALSKAVDAWNESIPEPYKVDKFTLAHNQRMVREGKATSIVDADKITQQFGKARAFTKDAAKTIVNKDGKTIELKGKIGKNAPAKSIEYDWERVNKLAQEGDIAAKDLLVSKQLYDKNYLKLVPHGLAEVTKDAAGSALSDAERIFAGKFSTRVYGNATYEDIAGQIKNANEWLDKQIQQFTESEIAREILEEGTIGGGKLVEDSAKAKDIVYLDRDVLATKGLSEALNKQIPTPTPNSIAIDKEVVEEIAKQFKTISGKPFGERWQNDIYQTAKQNLLASGGYLAGNFYTGVNNALMNSGFNPVTLAKDIAEAAKTKGKLAKEMGIYRNLSATTVRAKTPIVKKVQEFNKPLADMLNYVDAKMQNNFVEMAVHNRLRAQGVSLADRSKALADMDKVKLAESIHDARMVGLLNPNRTILPSRAHAAVGMLNPFWRWNDTALQSSLYMMRNHPIVNNLVLNQYASKIGYDKEMQNRLGLNVQSDKALVSYRYNPASKKLEEVSCEFIPQMNTIKLVGDTADALKKGDMSELPFKISPAAAPFFGAILNASFGKDKYGKPIIRPEADRVINGRIQVMQGDRRYRFDPNSTVGFEELKGGQGDEMLTAAINELIAYPKILNRVVMPTAAGVANLMGGNVRYYKPYANQIIGEINKAGEMPQYANPRSSAAGGEVADILTGSFARTYDPAMELKNSLPMMPEQQKQMMRGFGRRMGTDNMILGGQQ